MLKRTVVTLSLGLAAACTPPAPEPTNAPPSAPVVSIAPSSPKTADALKVSIVSPSVDPEGQAVTYGFQWLKDGAPQADLVTDTVPADRNKKGEAWSVLVTPSDGKASGTAGTAAVTVANTVPSATVALAPESPTALTGLTAVPAGSDEDGDNVTFAYSWTRNSQSTAFVEATIPAAEVKRGDTWKVTVTPSDGAAGEAVSATGTVGNALPVVASVTLEPAQPTKAGSLVAVPGPVTDADADATSVKHTWTVNGSEVTGQTAASLPAAHFKKGDTVTVSVRANDGTADGPAVTASTTVVNAVPTLTGAALSPLAGGKGDTFTCAPLGWSDADGDAEGYTYEWKVDGQMVGTGASLAGSALTKGQSVTCTVTPTDGTANGAPQTAAAAMVLNTPPALASVTLTPASPAEADTLTAIPTGYTDVDGDAAGYQYTWRRDGVVIPGQEGPTLASVHFARGQVITVEVRPFDGTAVGATVTSNAVTVVNSLPVLASVTVAPSGGSAPVRGTALVATAAGMADADGDPVSVQYEWKVNGTPVQGVSGNVLTGTQFSKGQVVTVTATPSDGLASGAPVTGNSVTIENSAPSISGVSISPTSGGKGATFTCTPSGWSDLDGDAEGYAYEWTAGSQVVGGGATLSGAGLTKGQSLTCTATPTDGVASGSPRTSAAVTVANTAPTLVAVTLSPANPTKLDTLTATPAGFADVDGDAEGYQYTWKRNGNAISGQTGPTLSSAHFAKGQLIAVEVRPFDGTAAGTAVTSNAVTVVNAPPQLASVTVAPSGGGTPTRGNALLASSAGVTDPDGDVVTVRHDWKVAGTAVNGVTGSILPGTSFSRGQVVTLVATPDDGVSSGTPVTGNSVTIQNAPPSAPGISITPAVPGDSDDLVCALSAPSTDADGDSPLYYNFTWTKNGLPFSSSSFTATSSTVSAANTSPSDTFSCVASAYDLIDSPATTTATVTVGGARSCKALLDSAPGTPNGVYAIDPDGNGPIAPANLYCDMTAGGWTLVANIYDSAGDDAPNSTNYVVSGWQQTGSGSWASSASKVDRDATGTGSAAVSMAFVAALKAGASQENLKMCFVHQDGTDTTCRSSADGTMTLVSYPTGNPKLTAYSGNTLPYTYGRLAGLAGSIDAYGSMLYTNYVGYPVPVSAGDVGEFGIAGGDGIHERSSITDWPSYNGVWHAGGWGMRYAPEFTNAAELAGGTTAGGDAVATPNLNTYGFRLYIGPEVPAVGSMGNPARSCRSILTANTSATDGTYWIDPDGTGPIAPANLFCDMNAGGWTLVANIYDSPGDDAPNSTDYVVSGWQQTGSGSWASSASKVDRDATGTGSAAVSMAFVAALKAGAGQQNLKMCFVHQNGTDTTCRSSADDSMALVSYSTGNPSLTIYSGDSLPYTFGRLAGLAGSINAYGSMLYTNYVGYPVPVIAGDVGEFGIAGGDGIHERSSITDWPSYNGVWVGGGWGIRYAPEFTDAAELAGGATPGGEAVANPNLNTYGFRLYIGQ